MNNSFYASLVLVKDIYVKLDINHKKKLFLLIIYTIFTASLEVFSLGLVIPFLGILLNETYLNECLTGLQSKSYYRSCHHIQLCIYHYFS